MYISAMSGIYIFTGEDKCLAFKLYFQRMLQKVKYCLCFSFFKRKIAKLVEENRKTKFP